MARISSGSAVTGLTAAAMAAVCVLAYQAAGSTPRAAAASTPSPSSPTAPPERAGSPTAEAPQAPPVPVASGAGKRVVYALGGRRVWLVNRNGDPVRTFPVAPSSVDPVAGTYKVTVRNKRLTGSDGVAIEHVVVFGSLGTTVIGFSAARDGSTPDPDSSKRTGGIRETREDGAAMWEFAVIGVKVVVVP